MATVAVTLLIVLTLYYSWFLLRARSGFRRLTAPAHGVTPDLYVSVVIAARNEESSISDCLRSLLSQSYPHKNYEIIVVDDHSSDGTVNVVRGFASDRPHIRLVTLQAEQKAPAAGKPAAIAFGVGAARGEIILTTDADCVVPPEWISRTVSYFTPDISFVAGPVSPGGDRTFLSRVDHLELLGLITVGAGLIGAGRPIICNGANLAYRKTAFQDARGYGDEKAWCDDETIMNRIHDRRLGKVAFAAEPETVVTTRSPRSLPEFWKQRLRWSSKGGHYESIPVLLSLVLLYFFFLFLLVMLVAGFSHPAILTWFFVSFLVKLLTDFVTLSAGAQRLRDRIPAAPFLIAEIFHVPYIVVTAALGQFISFTWKGRTVNA